MRVYRRFCHKCNQTKNFKGDDIFCADCETKELLDATLEPKEGE
jgi:hypothetical protein